MLNAGGWRVVPDAAERRDEDRHGRKLRLLTLPDGDAGELWWRGIGAALGRAAGTVVRMIRDQDREAYDLLIEARARLAGERFDMAKPAFVELSDRLATLSPFGRWDEHFVVFGVTAMPASVATTAIRRLMSGDDPETVINDVAAFEARNATEWAAYYLVKGIAIDRTHHIGDGEHLLPAAEVKRMENLRHLVADFGEPSPYVAPPTLHEIGTPRAVLVHKMAEEPGLVLSGQIERVGVGLTESIQRALDFHRACTLASRDRVAVPHVAMRLETSAVAGFASGEMSVPRDGVVGKAAEIDVGEVSRLLGRLRSFKKKETLALAIDRVARARFDESQEDQAIDYGTALEIATVGDAKVELSYRIATRAAWFLGGDLQERQQIFKQAKDLYDARSSAVHTGRLSKKGGFSPAGADAMIRELLRKILEMGEFPDWDSLTLGGP